MLKKMRKLCTYNAEELQLHQNMENEIRKKKNRIMRLNLECPSHYSYVVWNLGESLELPDVNAAADRIREDGKLCGPAGMEAPKTLLEYEETPYNTWESGVLFEYALYNPATGAVNFSFLASMLEGIKVEEINVAVSGWDEQETVLCSDCYSFSDSTKQIKEFMEIKTPAGEEAENKIKVRGTVYLSKNGCYLSPMVVEQYCQVAGEIQDIKVDAPVIKVQGHTEVRIGLGRQAYSDDLDYHYQNSSCIQLENRGRIFLQSGMTVDLDQTAASAGSCLIRKAPAGVSMTKSGFRYTYDSAANILTYSAEENWGKCAPWNAGDTCDMTNMINVVLQGGKILPVVITSVQESGVSVSGIGVYSVPQLVFLWGCLAEHTKVRMADGSQRSVQDIRIGDRLVCNVGNDILTVTEIWKGTESECLCIKTEEGLDITVTKEHPFKCEKGFLQAGELRKGDSVLTADGYQTIRKIDRIAYNGNVYNFDLWTEEELEHCSETTMIANGILVGDNRMQGRCLKERKGIA